MRDDVLVFISRRAILRDGSRAHLDCRSDAHRGPDDQGELDCQQRHALKRCLWQPPSRTKLLTQAEEKDTTGWLSKNEQRTIWCLTLPAGDRFVIPLPDP